MDAIIGVWLSSVLGAGAFSAAGYVLGQRGVVVPGLFLPQPPPPTASEAPRETRREPTLPDAQTSGPSLEPTVVRDMSQESLPGDATPTPPAFPAAALALALRDDEHDEGEDRPTVIPKKSDHAKLMAGVATIPPPRPPSISVGGDDGSAVRKVEAELAATKKELREARERADRAVSQASAAEAKSRELERQLDAVRNEHRHEVASRATASARAEELGDRLAAASEDAASLRHKVSTLERQTKQLREALQGRVRALTTSEWHRRREIEDAEEVQKKLRDVYEKLERSSMPPPTPAAPSVAPLAATAPMSPVDDGEVARLRAENERLRGQVLGSLAPKPRPSSRGSAPEIDIDAYRAMLERVEKIDGVRGVVVADELGSLVLGTGELAEGLAAFGAYIRDASERTERLLPIGVIDEIALKDKTGAMLHTRLLAEQPATLSFVVLGAGEYAVKGANKLVEEHLRDRI